jgi:hypothetical protein
MRGGEVYRFEAISRALAAAPEFAMALTRPGAEAIAAEAAAEAEAAQMAAEVVAEAAALERRHIPYKLRSRRMLAAAAAAAAEQQTTTTTTRLEGDAVVAAEAPTAAMAAATAVAVTAAAAAAVTATEASVALQEAEEEKAAEGAAGEEEAAEGAEGGASGAASSSGASAPTDEAVHAFGAASSSGASAPMDEAVHAFGAASSSGATAPMDEAVHAFDRRFERLERARHGAGLCEHAGTLTLTLPLTTYTGRVNEETFAKEAVWLANDRLVATGGDCGRLYIWSAVSGRLVYRAQADGSIVNCVAPHPSLPFVAVSGIDDGIKLFRVGGESHPPSKAPLFASCAPEANFHGWAVDAPPRCAALPADDCTVRLRSAGALRSEALKCLNRSQPKSTIQLLEAALHLVHVDVDVPNTALRLALGAERRQLWLLLASAWLEYGQPSAAHAWCDVLLASATAGATASVGGAAAGVDFVPAAVAVAEPAAAQDDDAATTDTVTAAARLEDARVIGKGYYRRATARLLLGRFDEAEEDVAAAQASEAAMAVDTEPGLRRMCDSLRARIGAARLSAHSHWERRLRRQWERQLRRRAPAEQDESEYQSDEEGSDEVEIAISDEVEMAHLCVGGEGDVGEEAQSGEEGEDEDEDEDEDEEEEDEGEEEEDDEDEDEDEDEDGDGEEDEDEDEDDEEDEDEDEDEEEAEEAEAEEEAEEAYDSALSPSAHNGGEGEDAHEDAEPSGAS